MLFDCQQFLKYIHSLPTDYGDSDIHSLLEFLGYYYLLYNPVDPEKAQQAINSLEPVFSRLSRRKSRLIRHTLSEIASIYTQEAFQHGILTGAHLILELTESHTTDSYALSSPITSMRK